MMKKEISDEVFEKAFYNSDNSNIIKKATSAYAQILQHDDLESCGINALWRTLKSHDESYGQKFTTSLFRFCQWECQRELRRKNRKNNLNFISIHSMSDDQIRAIDGLSYEHSRNFDEIIDVLDDFEKVIIDRMYRQDKNITEISKEFGLSKVAIKKKIDACLQKIKERYQVDESIVSE